MKKDTKIGMKDGKFKFLLVGRSGDIIDDCWESNQKKAWDLLIENKYSGENGVGKVGN